MPRIAKSYEKTTVYKIVCKDPKITDLYVGHTTDFRQRLRRHKEDSVKHPDRKLYKMILDNGGWDNWDMIMIETCCFNDVEEAKQREHYWYDKLKPTMNHNMPLLFGMTKEEVENECKAIQGGLGMLKRIKFMKIIKDLEEQIKVLKSENEELKLKIN
jgi:hypothetical protein